jgi:hypothetical protein
MREPKGICPSGSDKASIMGGKVMAAMLNRPAQHHPKPMLLAAISKHVKAMGHAKRAVRLK